MQRPAARYLPDEDGSRLRLHLQHGPIDLIIGVDDGGDRDLDARTPQRRRQAFAAAEGRFETVLEELVGELSFLRGKAEPDMPAPEGAVARRMAAAVKPFAASHFITPMAAVAGSVADEILHAMLASFAEDDRPRRAYVNNGGDIAVHLAGAAGFRIRIAREDNAALGAFRLEAASPGRGIATSGRCGRSLSLGIADSVTVVARDAAAADAAATLVANAVDLPGHPLVERVRAVDLVEGSDLGERLAVRGCGLLQPGEVYRALAAGVAEAERFIAAGRIEKAALFLQDQGRLAIPPSGPPPGPSPGNAAPSGASTA